MYHIGIDIGGTFTDGVVLDDTGAPRYFKTPTTRHDLLEGVRALVGARMTQPGPEGTR